MEQVGKKKKRAEANYGIYGYIFALHYWAYEMIDKVTSNYAKYHGKQSPRMLSWSSNKVPSAKELVELFDCTDISIFCNYLNNFFIYYMKFNFYFFYYSQLRVQSVLTPRFEERVLYDQIMQECLISTHMDVDDQDKPQPEEVDELHPEVEEASAQPSITFLEKLAMKMDKFEASVEKLTTDVAEIKANQQ